MGRGPLSGEREERDTPVAPGGTGWTPPSLPICPISPQEPPPDPERSLYYPLYLDLDLERGPWDDDEFDVDEGKVLGGGGGMAATWSPFLPPLSALPQRPPPSPQWRRAPSSRCAWQGMATSTPWPSGSRGCSRPTPSLAERRCSSASGRGIPLPAPPETGMLCAWRGRGQPSWSPPRRRGAGGHRERGEGASLGGPLAGSWVNKRRRCGRRELCVVWGALRGETWC